MSKVWFRVLCLSLFLVSNSAQADEKMPVQNGGDLQPLSLRDTIEKTLKNNVTISVQGFTPKIREKTVIDKQAEFDPSIYGSLSTDKKKQQVASVFAQPNVSINENLNWSVGLKQKTLTGANYQLSFDNVRVDTNSLLAPLLPMYTSQLNLTLTQPLLKNFGIDINRTNILIAKNDVAVSDFDFKGQVINIITNAQNVYWDLYFSIEDLKVKEKSLERARDLERTVRAQVSVGTMAPLEVISAQAEVAARDELVIIARKAIKDNEEILKNAMNVSFDSHEGQKPIRPTDQPAFTVKDKLDLEASLKLAFADRPDYLGKKKNLESKNIIIKYNQNQLYPSIDLVASSGLNGIAGRPKDVAFGGTTLQSPYKGNYYDSLGNVFSTDYYQWSVGVQLNYPLGNRSAESRLAASRLDAEQLLLDIKDLEKKIIVDVREAIRLLDTTAKNVEATRVARKLAEERLRAEEKKLKVGLSTSFNVLVIQENLATQESNEIKAVIDYNKAEIKLQQVVGNTLEKNNIQLATRTMQ